MDHQETGDGSMDRIDLAQDGEKWRDFFKNGTEPSGSIKCFEFPAYLRIVNFSRTLLYGIS
jgi:hypothetical protein